MRWLTVVIACGVVGVLMYALGYQQGSRSAALSAPVEIAQVPQTVSAPEPKAPHSDMPAEFAQAVQVRDWDALVAVLEAAHNDSDEDSHQAMHLRMLQIAAEFGEQDAPEQGVRMLEKFVQLNPHDHQALFALAELHAQRQDYSAAVESVLSVLDFPLTVEIADRASKARDGYINAYLEHLDEADLDARIALFERLRVREPTNDAHRLQLAEQLTLSGQLDAAADVLAEIGGYGVDATDVAQARRELQMAAAGVPIQREDNALYADVEVNGETLRLLVDTGASKTAIDSAALAEMQARRANRVARLLTAGGPVRAEVYEVDNLRFGSLQLEVFEVVALDSVPSRAQGLLGMDLLNQVSDLGFQ